MSHPYTPLQSMIDAADKAQMHLERHGGAPGWEQWEKQSRDSLRAARQLIAITEAVWDRWSAYCARLAGDTSYDAADRRAEAVINKAVRDGFPMEKVDAIGNEIRDWSARQR